MVFFHIYPPPNSFLENCMEWQRPVIQPFALQRAVRRLAVLRFIECFPVPDGKSSILRKYCVLISQILCKGALQSPLPNDILMNMI